MSDPATSDWPAATSGSSISVASRRVELGFSPSALGTHLLDLLPEARTAHYRVAFSGGLDSTVLLHAMAALRDAGFAGSLAAVHVHHGLHPDADDWARRAGEAARVLDLDCRVIRVSAEPARGESPEAAARSARYAALAEILEPGQILLTGQHRDDQIETLLLQLLRGAGPAGLAGMPARRPLGSGEQVRPLLDYSRADLLDWARAEQLSWVDDPTNLDPDVDRSYLRHRVLPGIEARWPGMRKALARSAGLCADAAELMQILGGIDCATAARDDWIGIPALAALSRSRAANALRAWLREQGMRPPSERRLASILDDLVGARESSGGEVLWSGGGLRRWHDRLYAVGPLPAAPTMWIEWPAGRNRLDLPDGLGVLERPSGGVTSGNDPLHGPLSVRWRHGGERLRPVSGGPSRSVKKLMQEAGVRPWMRSRVPFIYAGERLVSVGDLWTDDSVGIPGAAGFRWHGRPRIF